jgi:hypothetical protein
MPRGKRKGMSKMQAVRNAIASGGKDIKPAAILEYVKTNHNITMSVAMASNYKSHILRKGKRRRKMQVAKAPAAVRNGGITMADIQTIKALADRLGAKKVQQLAAVLAK